jgi:hypothetical protein
LNSRLLKKLEHVARERPTPALESDSGWSTFSGLLSTHRHASGEDSQTHCAPV